MGKASGTAARRVTVGLFDQVVIALANAGNNLLALALLDRARAGVMLLSLGVGYFVIGVNRAFVGEVLLTLASRYEGTRQERLIRNGAATALVVAGSAAVLLLVAWLSVPASGRVDLRDLVWVAPLLPGLVLHFNSGHGDLVDPALQPGLVFDTTWVSIQFLPVSVLDANRH